jgi:ribosomal subunit interface protein
MLQNVTLTPVHITIDDKLEAYALRKLGRLDRYVSRGERDTANLDIRLIESTVHQKKVCHCEATLQMSSGSILVQDETLNMYAAIDIVRAKLKQQLIKHESKYHNGKMRRHLLARLRDTVA